MLRIWWWDHWNRNVTVQVETSKLNGEYFVRVNAIRKEWSKFGRQACKRAKDIHRKVAWVMNDDSVWDCKEASRLSLGNLPSLPQRNWGEPRKTLIRITNDPPIFDASYSVYKFEASTATQSIWSCSSPPQSPIESSPTSLRSTDSRMLGPWGCSNCCGRCWRVSLPC